MQNSIFGLGLKARLLIASFHKIADGFTADMRGFALLHVGGFTGTGW